MKITVKPLLWKHEPKHKRWIGLAGKWDVVIIHYTWKTVLASFTILPIAWQINHNRSARFTVRDARLWADKKWSMFIRSNLQK